MKLITALFALSLYLPSISKANPHIDKDEAQIKLNAFAFKTIQSKLSNMYENLPADNSKVEKVNGFPRDYVEVNCLLIYTNELFWQTMPEIHYLLEPGRKNDIESDYYNEYNCNDLISESKVKLLLEDTDY